MGSNWWGAIDGEQLSPNHVQRLVTYLDEHTEIFDFVFGRKGERNILVGNQIDCTKYLYTNYVKSLEKLDFITCHLEANLQYPPDVAAEYLINLCQEHKKRARSLGLTSQIMCSIEREVSSGEMNAVESVLAYKEFWCKIAGEASRDKNLPKIQMWTAIEPPISLSVWDSLLNSSIISLGWWRRTHPTSYKQEAFAERVDEVFNSNCSFNCKRLCSICEKSSDCCIGTCISDGVLNSTFVCRLNSTICEPHSSSLRFRKKSNLLRNRASDSKSIPKVPINSSSTTLLYALAFTISGFIVVICLLIYYYVSSKYHKLLNIAIT